MWVLFFCWFDLNILCSLFLFVAMQKEKVNRKRKTRVFTCNPSDCSSPDGRTSVPLQYFIPLHLGRGCHVVTGEGLKSCNLLPRL